MTFSTRALTALLPSAADYRVFRSSWRVDLLAGLTVGIVALPLALAFGISSGVGAEAGLVTAIVAGVVAAVFGGSSVQVSGPTGAMVVVLAPIVVTHGVASVAMVSVLAGLIVLVAGVTGIGRIVAYIPWPVIEGFTLGIAITIALQQVPNAVAARGDDSNAAVAAWQAVRAAHPHELLFSLAAVVLVAAIMVTLTRFAPKLPASMIAIVLVSVLAAAIAAPLQTIGTLPASLPAPSFPPISWDGLRALAGPAVAVAALAAIESLLSARVAAAMADNGPFQPDRELVGQGLASIAAGMFGGMPATGAIARTAVNVRSGARTRVAAITHAVVLLAMVLFAASWVARIPLAALAGVLLVTTTRMVGRSTLRAVWGAGRGTVVVFVLTAIITVSFDLIVAVGIGVAVAVVLALRTLARSSVATREEIAAAQPGDEHIAVIRMDGALYFGAGERISQLLTDAGDVWVVVLRLSGLQLFDATGAHQLAEVVQQLERRGITVILKGIRPEHQRLAASLGVISSLRHANHLCADLPSAIEHARSHVQRELLARAGSAAPREHTPERTVRADHSGGTSSRSFIPT